MAKKKKREGKSYTSLILGIVVVVIALTLIVAFIKSRQAQNVSQTKPEVSSQKTENLTESKSLSTTYTVVEGDYLWSIAENYYKSGYSWVDIAKANNLENPDLLFVGTKLIIPTVNEEKEALISETSYTVVKGDCLWNIAVRAYGDGYRWVDIAKANNLISPDLIHTENVLVIPR